jgi:putative flippase GtrA
MDEHVHTGIVTFVTTGVYAVLFIWGMRLIAAKMVEYPATKTLGAGLGAIVHFGS